MLIAVMSAFLMGAVVYDIVSHRLPNYFLLLGLIVALALQIWATGWAGLLAGGYGMVTGFILFVPFYALGGMAAGDVKLMAVVGFFLGVVGAFWAAAYSLILGAILGFFYLTLKGQLGRLISRYWAMASLQVHIPAEEGDAALHRFPYAIAIAAGTLLSLYWKPI